MHSESGTRLREPVFVPRLRQLEDGLHGGVIRSHASGCIQAFTGLFEMARIAAQGNVNADLAVEQEGGDSIIDFRSGKIHPDVDRGFGGKRLASIPPAHLHLQPVHPRRLEEKAVRIPIDGFGGGHAATGLEFGESIAVAGDDEWTKTPRFFAEFAHVDFNTIKGRAETAGGKNDLLALVHQFEPKRQRLAQLEPFIAGLQVQ